MPNNALQSIQNGLRNWTEHMPIPSPRMQSIAQEDNAASDESSGDDVQVATDDDTLNVTDGFISEVTPPEGAIGTICFGRVRNLDGLVVASKFPKASAREFSFAET